MRATGVRLGQLHTLRFHTREILYEPGLLPLVSQVINPDQNLPFGIGTVFCFKAASLNF